MRNIPRKCFAFLLIALIALPLEATFAAESRAAATPMPKRPLVNGGFGESAVGQPPAGWNAAYPNKNGVVMNDGKDTFLRLANAQPTNAGMAQVVEVPPKTKVITVTGRMRGKPENEKIERRAAIEVALRFQDAGGANIGAAVVASTNSPNWHTFKRVFTPPIGCVRVEVVARSIFATGTFDFDEVAVDFR